MVATNSDRYGAVAMLRCQCSLTGIACESLGVQLSGKRWFFKSPGGHTLLSEDAETHKWWSLATATPGLRLLVSYMPLAEFQLFFAFQPLWCSNARMDRL